MKLRSFVSIIMTVIVLTSICGCAYVNVKIPFDRNLDKTELGTKKGTATAHSILWLVSWGDTSYATAAKNGDIKVIRHADQEVQQVLFGLYTRWQVVVYGD
jgi:TRL (tRNA-associated locus)-like protein